MAAEIKVRHFATTVRRPASTDPDYFVDFDLGENLGAPKYTRLRLVASDHVKTGDATQVVTTFPYESDQRAIALELVDHRTVRIHMTPKTGTPTSADDIEVRFHTITYQGAPGGPNEFIVVDRGLATMGAGVTSVLRLFANIPGIGGSPGAGDFNKDFINYGLGCVATSDGVAEDGDYAIKHAVTWFFSSLYGWGRASSVAEVNVAFELVDYRATNWTADNVNRHGGGNGPTWSAAGLAISWAWSNVGSWNQTEIIVSRDHNNVQSYPSYQGMLGYPGADVTHIRVFQELGGQTTGSTWFAFTLSNPNVVVDHNGSIYRGAAAIPEATPIQTVTQTPFNTAAFNQNLDHWDGTIQASLPSLTGNHDGGQVFVGTLQDSGSGYPRMQWRRNRSNLAGGVYTVKWHQQLIEYPASAALSRYGVARPSIDVDAAVDLLDLVQLDTLPTVELDAAADFPPFGRGQVEAEADVVPAVAADADVAAAVRAWSEVDVDVVRSDPDVCLVVDGRAAIRSSLRARAGVE